MGVWGVGLKSSDEFAEVQDEFFDQYIEGSDPIVIAADIRKRYEEEFPDDDGQIMNTVLFLLLRACGNAERKIKAFGTRSVILSRTAKISNFGQQKAAEIKPSL